MSAVSLQSPDSCADPCISVVVPVYRVRDCIVPCMRSLFAQTLQEPFEVVMVDDADPDESVHEVQAMEQEKPGHIFLQYLRHERNRGLSAARNTGTSAAKGEYVIYVDSDDALYPHALASLLEAARRHHADVAVGGVTQTADITLSTPEERIVLLDPAFYPPSQSASTYLQKKIYCMAWNKLVRRRFIERSGLSFREGYIHEDEMWSLELFLARPACVCIPSPTYIYRLQRAGSIMAQNRVARFPNIITVLNINADTLRKQGYGDEAEAHFKLSSTMHNALQKLFLAAAGLPSKERVAFAKEMAACYLGVSPELRRHFRKGGVRRVSCTALALALPCLRKAVLTLLFYALSLRNRH